MSLRKWLRDNELFDGDIEKELASLDVENEDTLGGITADQLKEFERKVKVARAKDLKDQKSKVRLEKKLTKIRKMWEKKNGKDTKSKKKAAKSSKPSSPSNKGGNVSAKANNEALANARGLKAWMQKEQIWEKDLFGVLVTKGLTGAGDNIGAEIKEKIPTRKALEEVIREVRVLRAQDLKDQKAKSRLEKLLSKFEKRWETATGLKKTTLKKGSKANQGKKKPNKNDEPVTTMASTGRELKQWMQKEECWQKDLFNELLVNGVNSGETLMDLSEAAFHEIIRKVRVAKAQELKDQKSKARLEKVLTKFEKEWRNATGISKTTIKKGMKAASGGKKDAAPSEEKINEMATEGRELKQYMQAEEFWQLDLYNELLAENITNAEALAALESDTFHEIVRKVTVTRAQDLKDAKAKQRLEKVLTKFEKEWEKQSGHKKTTIKAGMKAAKGGKKEDAPADQRNKELATKGKELKTWMQSEDIWQKDLYDALMNSNIYGPSDLSSLDQTACDDIIRKVRVERATQLKDQKAKDRADKLLVSFEKAWKAVCDGGDAANEDAKDD